VKISGVAEFYRFILAALEKVSEMGGMEIEGGEEHGEDDGEDE
jgi:hypothetical protein